MNQNLDKTLAKELMKTEGEARGMSIKEFWNYVLSRKGKEGIKEMEKRMEELGFPLKYREINDMDFYPIGFDLLSLLLVKEIFNLDEKGIEEMGASIVRFSLFFKIFFKYFGSLELIARQVPKFWQRYYTVGELEMPDYSNEKRYIVLRLKNFKVHPVYCPMLRGYLSQVAKLILGVKPTCSEEKCVYRGDAFHQFLIKW
jgi:hypothetical protein